MADTVVTRSLTQHAVGLAAKWFAASWIMRRRLITLIARALIGSVGVYTVVFATVTIFTALIHIPFTRYSCEALLTFTYALYAFSLAGYTTRFTTDGFTMARI